MTQKATENGLVDVYQEVWWVGGCHRGKGPEQLL